MISEYKGLGPKGDVAGILHLAGRLPQACIEVLPEFDCQLPVDCLNSDHYVEKLI
jgi:hypothetical protein